MIHATFRQNRCGQLIAVTVRGHANSGRYGEDIVCAAVSVLSITFVNNIQRLAQYQPVVTVDEEEGGYLALKLPDDLTEEQKEISQILFESFYFALVEDMQEEYENYIQVELKTEE